MATITPPIQVADAYSRLGLEPGASLAEVKRAFRRLAKQSHPDHAGSGSLETFLAVKAAYEWIVAHPLPTRPGGPRSDAVPRTTVARSVRRAPPMTARPVHASAARGSWPGGRWYWEAIHARSSRR
jgi:hypothetical protein